MANVISGQIIVIGQTQTITPKNGQGNPLIKREFVIRELRFNPEDGSPELSQYNTPMLEVNGAENAAALDKFKVGDVVRVTFTIEGRKVVNQDNSERYFNSVRAKRVDKANVSLPQMQVSQPAQQHVPNVPQNVQNAVDENGNPLPF